MAVTLIITAGMVSALSAAAALMNMREAKRMEECRKRLTERWAILEGEYVEFTAEELAWRTLK